MPGKIFEKHISNYLGTRGADDKICGKILSTNAFTVPITGLMQRRTSESVAMERVSKKVGKQLNEHILEADTKRVTPK